jgi:hypothetical protein
MFPVGEGMLWTVEDVDVADEVTVDDKAVWSDWAGMVPALAPIDTAAMRRVAYCMLVVIVINI